MIRKKIGRLNSCVRSYLMFFVFHYPKNDIACFVWLFDDWNISFHIYTDFLKHDSEQNETGFLPRFRIPYCWWKKSCTSWYDKYPIIYRVSYKNAATMTVVDKLRLPWILDVIRTKWCIFIPLQDRRVSPKNPGEISWGFLGRWKHDVFFDGKGVCKI